MMLLSRRQLLCRYTNATPRVQIVRISNIPEWFFERTVAPKTTLIFEAWPEARLEVHTGAMMSAILSDVIPCTQLEQSNRSELKRSRFDQQFA